MSSWPQLVLSNDDGKLKYETQDFPESKEGIGSPFDLSPLFGKTVFPKLSGQLQNFFALAPNSSCLQKYISSFTHSLKFLNNPQIEFTGKNLPNDGDFRKEFTEKFEDRTLISAPYIISLKYDGVYIGLLSSDFENSKNCSDLIRITPTKILNSKKYPRSKLIYDDDIVRILRIYFGSRSFDLVLSSREGIEILGDICLFNSEFVSCINNSKDQKHGLIYSSNQTCWLIRSTRSLTKTNRCVLSSKSTILTYLGNLTCPLEKLPTILELILLSKVKSNSKILKLEQIEEILQIENRTKIFLQSSLHLTLKAKIDFESKGFNLTYFYQSSSKQSKQNNIFLWLFPHQYINQNLPFGSVLILSYLTSRGVIRLYQLPLTGNKITLKWNSGISEDKLPETGDFYHSSMFLTDGLIDLEKIKDLIEITIQDLINIFEKSNSNPYLDGQYVYKITRMWWIYLKLIQDFPNVADIPINFRASTNEIISLSPNDNYSILNWLLLSCFQSWGFKIKTIPSPTQLGIQFIQILFEVFDPQLNRKDKFGYDSNLKLVSSCQSLNFFIQPSNTNDLSSLGLGQNLLSTYGPWLDSLILYSRGLNSSFYSDNREKILGMVFSGLASREENIINGQVYIPYRYKEWVLGYSLDDSGYLNSKNFGDNIDEIILFYWASYQIVKHDRECGYSKLNLNMYASALMTEIVSAKLYWYLSTSNFELSSFNQLTEKLFVYNSSGSIQEREWTIPYLSIIIPELVDKNKTYPMINIDQMTQGRINNNYKFEFNLIRKDNLLNEITPLILFPLSENFPIDGRSMKNPDRNSELDLIDQIFHQTNWKKEDSSFNFYLASSSQYDSWSKQILTLIQEHHENLSSSSLIYYWSYLNYLTKRIITYDNLTKDKTPSFVSRVIKPHDNYQSTKGDDIFNSFEFDSSNEDRELGKNYDEEDYDEGDSEKSDDEYSDNPYIDPNCDCKSCNRGYL